MQNMLLGHSHSPSPAPSSVSSAEGSPPPQAAEKTSSGRKRKQPKAIEKDFVDELDLENALLFENNEEGDDVVVKTKVGSLRALVSKFSSEILDPWPDPTEFEPDPDENSKQ